jgi:hypothetical protein
MPVFLLKPDNFTYPHSIKPLQASTGQELLERIQDTFAFPAHVQVHVYTGPRYTKRTRLDTQPIFTETDPCYAWIYLTATHPAPAPVPTAPNA